MGYRNLLKDKLKNIIKLFYQNSSENNHLSVRYAANGLLHCKWSINPKDNTVLLNDSEIILCIRIYDITNGQFKEKSTCIMKEIAVKKRSRDCYLSTPVKDGKMLIEIGYRKAYGKWFLIASSTVELDNRKVYQMFFPDDSWFYPQKLQHTESEGIHEKIYQLSNPSNIGGSDEIH